MLDVIVPSYNNLHELKKCLQGFEKQKTNYPFRVLVCVDGSTDGTLEFLQETSYNFPVKVLMHPDNIHQGREKTRNLALPEVQAPYVLFFDADLVPTENLIQAHLDLLIREENLVSLGRVEFVNTRKNLWAAYYNSRGTGKFEHLQAIPYYYFTTGNSAMPSRFFLGVNGQNENLPGYGGGDAEMMFRIRKKFPVKVLVNRKALAYGEMNKTLKQALRQRFFMGKTNLKYIAEHYPDEDEYNKLKWFKGKGLMGKIFPLLFNPIAKKFFEFLVYTKFFPQKWKFIGVHYLKTYYMYLGFKEK